MKDFSESIAVIISASHSDNRWEADFPVLQAGLAALILVLRSGNGPNGEVTVKSEKCIEISSAGKKSRGSDLKKAFHYILEHCPQITHIVLTDCCEPLSVNDINACVSRIPEAEDKLILGSRNFERPEVSGKYRAGNKATACMLRLCYGVKISDPQSGLRVIPRKCLEQFCTISANGPEYETNMLLNLKRWETGIIEQPIEAICGATGEEQLHPFLDAWRVFRVLLKYVLSSLSSTVVDLTFYYLMMKFAGLSLGGAATLVSTVVARVISSFVNFNLNNSAVFGNKGNYRQALIRYYCLCVPQMLVSAGLVTLVNRLLAVSAPSLATVVKFVIDTCLFFISYQIQREWVFSEKKKK